MTLTVTWGTGSSARAWSLGLPGIAALAESLPGPQTRKGILMKMLTRAALALSGAAAALVLAGLLVLAVVVGVALLFAAISPPPTSARVTPPPPAPAAAAAPFAAAAPGGTGLHIASLTGCISGLNC